MKRVKWNVSEEELLKQQEEFEKSKEKCSTTFTGPGREASSVTQTTERVEESAPCIIGNIVERKVVGPVMNKNFHLTSSGFPQAKRRHFSGNSKCGSIFSQQQKKAKAQIEQEKVEMNDPSTENIQMEIEESSVNIVKEQPQPKNATNLNLPDKSYILSGEEKEKLHEENVNKLKSMTEEEIIKEQQELLSKLNPDLVEFLRGKRNKKVETIEENVEDIYNEPVVDITELETAKEIVESSDRWIHFDKIEIEKLQWMKKIEIPKPPKPNVKYEARFDFNGYILPYSESDITEKHRPLYHHGEEPGRPGYTLMELFKLSRTNVIQQRILALNTISNILNLYWTGAYEGLVDVPLEQIFFLVRISLDDNSTPLVNASIKTMHSLFYNKLDEACLDGLASYGYLLQPIIVVEKDIKNKEEENEINDQQLAEMDLVGCFIRSNILLRIRYILNKIKPPVETVNYCLEILIRLMRDSEENAIRVYNFEDLFSIIIKYFVPICNKIDEQSYEKPMVSALKLLRVASSRRKRMAEDFVNRYDIMRSIISYLWHASMKYQIESLNLLTVFFHYGLAVDSMSELHPAIQRLLDYHLKNTDINENTKYLNLKHFSAIVNTLAQLAISQCHAAKPFLPILEQLLVKYTNQASVFKNYECGKLQPISTLIVCITNILKYSSSKSEILEKSVLNLLNSEGFNSITKNIKNGSNLLCTQESYKCSPNMKVIEAVVWNSSEHIIPCLHRKSCIPFLASLTYCFDISSDQIKQNFLSHTNIKVYFDELLNKNKLEMTSNWFTICEANFLLNVLKAVYSIRRKIGDLKYYFELCVKSLPVFRFERKVDVDFLLKNIVFNIEFYPEYIRLSELHLENDQFKNLLDYLSDIYECYRKAFQLDKSKFYFTTKYCLDTKLLNVFPIDWIFYPIIKLYALNSDKNITSDETEDSLIILRSLQCIYLYEYYFPDLANIIDPTDRFCRLACVFLCSNSIFLEPEIRKLLELCLRILLKDENVARINFDKEIQGLSNFEDIYKELLEHFQSVSYGDSVFANYILVPIAQRNNVKYRKILWSEYAGVIENIKMDFNEFILKKEDFLYPPEKDEFLIDSYMRSLNRINLSRTKAMKQIARFHVVNFCVKK